MGFITKTLVKQAISLGTLNPKIIDKFFNDIKFKSYDYDYLIQDQLIDIHIQKANFKTDVMLRSDIILDGVRDGFRDKVGIFQLDKSIVYYGKRKSFKHFSMYNKPLPQTTMMTRRDIFKYGVLTFINGIMNTDFRIQARDDKTFLLFPYNKWDKTILPTDTITSVMIPESIVIPSRLLSDNDKVGNTQIKINVFDEQYTKYFKECNGFMAFFVKTGYRPLFYSNIFYNADAGTLMFESMPASLSGYSMVLVGMECYDSTISIRGDEKYFSIPKHNMPIPAKNLLVMVQDGNGYSYHINHDEVTIIERYPNVYEIDNPTRLSFKVVVLYSNKSANELIDYDTEIDYFLSLVNLVDRYREDNVPECLAEYKPIPWDYLIRDYEESIGLPTPSDPWFPFLYKLNKISSIYKIWCLFFQTYIRRTYGFLENWTLDVSTIDLNARVRESTLPEIPMKYDEYRPFPRPMCLFKYKNFSNYDTTTPYAWFIDGRFVVPYYVASFKGYQYVYFEASDLKPDSLIEIERFDGNQFNKVFPIGTEPLEVTISWLERPTLANTVFLTDGEGNYLNEGYRLSVKDKSHLGDYWFTLDLDKSVFILENGMRLKIEPMTPEYQNKSVAIMCNNKSQVWDVDTSKLGNFNVVNLNKDGHIELVKQDILPRVRVFDIEGRMYPRYGYTQSKNSNVKELPYFEILTDASKGKPFHVEYMGYDEKLVYELEDVEASGIINLEGKLDKPFSLTYHTVFLNGYKLNEKNIVQLSPFVIALQNVHTLHYLTIYERDHSKEFFGFLEHEPSSYIADKLLYEDPDYFETIMETLDDIVIDPSIINIDEEISMFLALIKEYLMNHNVNMDDIHDPAEFDRYEEVFNSWKLLMNADDRVRENIPDTNWFYMNHDLNVIFNEK